MSKDKAYIDKIFSSSKHTTGPTLLKFQNGSLSAINKQTTKFHPVLHSQKRTRGVVVVANGHVYHGLVGQGPVSDALTDTYICVKSRRTNKVRIIPIEQVCLNNQIYKQLENTRVATKMTEDNSKHVLLKQFGGRKASRYAANAEQMKMDIGLVQKDLESIVDETSLTDLQLPNGEIQYDLIRPKFNKDATTLHEIYDVFDVVPQELLNLLEEEAKVVRSTKLEKLPIKSEYIKQCIKDIQDSTPSEKGILNLKLVIYMDALLNLMTSRVRILDKLELSGITEKVENDIRLRFSDPNNTKKRIRNAMTTEKALCYFIVLAVLTSDKYQLDINVLAKEVCMKKPKIIKLAHIVNVKKKASSDMLTLNLPSKVTPLGAKFSRRAK